MYMKSQIYYIIIIAAVFLPFSKVKSQPKLSIDFGAGLYQPTLEGFEENDGFPTTGFLNKNLLLNYGIYYEFFSNARIGYNTLSSYDLGSIKFSESSEGFEGQFSRALHYRIFAIETFFRWKPKVELNFTLSPVWGKGVLTVDTDPEDMVDDWNEIVNSFGDDNPMTDMTASASMSKNWIGYAGIIGIRYYFSSRLAIDLKSGFLNNFYKEDDWTLYNKKVKGPKMKIDELPIFSLKFVYGIK